MDRLAQEDFEAGLRYEKLRFVRALREGEERKRAERLVLLICVVTAVAIAGALAAQGEPVATAAALAAATGLAGVLATLARGSPNALRESESTTIDERAADAATPTNIIGPRVSRTSQAGRSTSPDPAPPA